MTGKIFLKLIAGVFCLLLAALVAVDTFATSVAKDAYLQDLKRQLADECRLAALANPDPAAMGAAEVRRLAAAVGGALPSCAPTAKCWWIPKPMPAAWKTTARGRN